MRALPGFALLALMCAACISANVAPEQEEDCDCPSISGFTCSAGACVPMTSSAQTLANLTLNESAYNFGSVTDGMSQPHTVTVTNIGNASATNLTIAGLSGQYTPINSCGASLAAGASCAITVTYAPTAAGETDETLTISYDNGTATASVTDALSGTGVGDAALSLGEASYDFGDILVNTSPTHVITVTNAMSDETATNLTVSGLTAPYSQTNNCATLAAGASCTITVTYAPTAAGEIDETLTISYDNGTATASVTDALSGTGVGDAALSLGEASYDFGDILVNTSPTHVITVTNAMSDETATNLTVSGLTAPYSQTNNCATLAAGASCAITVTYAPTAAGEIDETLTISYDNGAATASVTDALSGTGVGDAALSLGEASYDFGDILVNTSPTHVITVTNAMSDETATNLTVSGLTAPYSQTNNCATLAAGASCAITVTYAPTAAGEIDETLTISYDNGAATASVTDALSGTGVGDAALSLGEASYDFGDILVNTSPTHVITVTNAMSDETATNLTVSGLTAPYSQTNNCATLAAGASCTITVTYAPTAAGEIGETLTISYDNGAATASVTDALSGTGIFYTQVTSGAFYDTCALSSAGNVYCWGYNVFGELGNNTNTEENTPVEVLGVGGSGNLSGISSIAAGLVHTCALSMSGNVYCWGDNTFGELGNNTNTDENTPVEVLGVGGSGDLSGIASIAAGDDYTCALSMSANVYCWGYNAYGELGNNTTTEENTPVEVVGVGASGNLSGIASIAASTDCTCALSMSGNVYCWGDDEYGQLGNNTNIEEHTPVEVLGVSGSGYLSGIASITLEQEHTCALSSAGDIYCWGDNTFGELGNGTTAEENTPGQNTPVEVLGFGGSGYLSGIVGVTAGFLHTCALSSGGNVYCWGDNEYGELGNNTTTEENTPVEVLGVGASGYLSSISGVAAGTFCTCAVSSDGNVYCWGDDVYGQLGNNSTSDESVPAQVVQQ